MKITRGFKTQWSCFVLVLAISVFGVAISVRAEESPIKAALLPYVTSNWLAGAVTVVVGPEGIISHETVGYADVAGKKPMKKNAFFWIASMTKPVTAVALMMLVADGKVSLDDPVSKYVPQMNNLWVTERKDDSSMTLKRQVRPITIRQLLSHTSGLPFLTPVLTDDLSSLPLDQAVLSFTMNPLEYQPGEGYRYSNQGIDTVGRVIEVASGIPYEKFMQTRLFDPLGMKDTTFFPTSRQLKRLPKSYAPNAEKSGLVTTNIPFMRTPFDRPGRYPEPGGGLFSTGRDLAHFCQMLLNKGMYNGKRFLSETAIAELTKIQTGKPDQKYGLGFAVDQDGHGAFGHGGAQGTNMTIYPERQLALIWMVQVRGGYPGKGSKARDAFNEAAFKLWTK
ncbi:MAG: serine hydrolase [Kiritimatiellae bacterium]|nr:serine hydrolase [Kiritimatiellia bacterium]MDD5519328.1 serine hydrolase [Kiritimatiellia bacterium]